MTLNGRGARQDTDHVGGSSLRRFASAILKSEAKPSGFIERARLLRVLFYNPKLKSSLLYRPKAQRPKNISSGTTIHSRGKDHLDGRRVPQMSRRYVELPGNPVRFEAFTGN
jgi:hypothetical protein